jgi:endonuclease-3
MRPSAIRHVVRILRRAVRQWTPPAIEQVCRSAEAPGVASPESDSRSAEAPGAASSKGRSQDDRFDPFLVLVSCMLSLRTKDDVTVPASRRLFALAKTPAALARLPEAAIAKAIYPVGFYRTKARHVRQVARLLLERHDGRVPATIEELVTLPGVGRKTANLVVTVGYRKPGICVDTHVHRISNRLGYVKTQRPDETETALRRQLPKPYWITFNDLLVTFGQNLCVPVSPWCSRCPVARYCDRVGVTTSR